ncbi:RNA polymerase sigma factor [Myxococcota bacterium]
MCLPSHTLVHARARSKQAKARAEVKGPSVAWDFARLLVRSGVRLGQAEGQAEVEWAAVPRPSIHVTVCRVEAQDRLEVERQLCARARAGDRKALGALLESHGPRLFRSVLLPRLGSRVRAEEALSITYMKVVEHFHRFEWQEIGLYPWLRVVALRVALDQIRARRREVLFEPADLERELANRPEVAIDEEAWEQHDRQAARQHVLRLLERLHPRYAQAIRLRVLEQHSREEAARGLGVTVATFDVLLHRSLVALRKVLQASGVNST